MTNTDLVEKVSAKLIQYGKVLDLSECQDLVEADFQAMDEAEEQIQTDCPLSKKRMKRAAKGPNVSSYK